MPPYGNYVNQIENHRLVLQSDANLVQYGHLNGHLVSPYGLPGHLLPDQLFGAPHSVIPNGRTVNVVSGTVLLGAGQGDGEIVNVGNSRIGVRDGGRHVGLANGGVVSVAVAGTVSISTATYEFDALQGPNGGTVSQRDRSLDATIPGGGNRWRLEVHEGGGLHLHRPLPGEAAGTPGIKLWDLDEARKE